MLVGLMGRAGSGKDTVAGFIRAQGWASVAFADPLKVMVRDTWNLPDAVLWGPSELRELPIYSCPCGWTGVNLYGDERDGICCGDTGKRKPTMVDGEMGPGMVYGPPVPLSARLALQRLGTEWGRALDEDVWARTGVRRAQALEGAIPPFAGAGPLEEHRSADGTMWPGITAFELGEDVLKGVAISDCRFANEARLIRAAGGVVWKIERPVPTECYCGAKLTERARHGCDGPEHHQNAAAWRNHDSETKSADISPDLTITNSGFLETLEALVRSHLP